ncbi:MAG: excinuclease ABC subunit UvrC [Pontimonas sp.]|nr:excinuclease ABC subunit UvrC [Pontimonas sp.]
MATRYDWQPSSGDIPTTPGVYRFLDQRNRVIYVGKAKNLRSRLQSYFAEPVTLHERTRRMVQSAASLDWTLVPTERQALQLEYLWIKQFQPEFNVRFRDDKSYPYLVVTVADDIPRVFLARKKGIKGAKYFGPFPTTGALRDTLSTILKAFPVRSCSQTTYAKAQRDNRPCLLGDIGKCAAPCVARVSQPEHKALALSLASFMAGNDRGVVEDLTVAMNNAAANLEFERAAKARDRIEAIETILMKNTMVLDERVDADVFGVAADGLVAAAHVFRVRGGRIRGAKGFIVETPATESGETLVEMILRDGFDEQPPARVVVVPDLPANAKWWERQLTEARLAAGEEGHVRLKTAQRGELAELGASVGLNARHTLQSHLSHRTSDPVARSHALAELRDALGLEEAPLRIECFDVSHLGGENQVASMVVFEDGLPRREHYRKFAVEGARDDTEAIHQVISRRVARLQTSEDPTAEATTGFRYPPGLLIVDGGLPQVNAAARALQAAGVSIPVCGVAKKLEEIWVPGADFPLILPRSSEGLFLVQRVRDEAHRVAITYQRGTRKRTLTTELTDIPGVGSSTARELLKRFKSVSQLKKASLEDLMSVEGVGPKLADTIHAFFGDS